MTAQRKRIALVAGASVGIGRAVVRQLHAAGHLVVAAGRDANLLHALPAHACVAADTTTADGAALAVAASTEAWGQPPDLLAHCVGSTLIAPLHRTSDDEIDKTLRINLASTLFVLRAWIGAQRETGRPGAAVLVSSVVARIGVANHEAIAAAKGGVEALVGGWRPHHREAAGQVMAFPTRP